MAAKRKQTTTYNRILKEFTKLNSKLPEDRKLSIQERRKIIKEQILPRYKNVPAYKVKVKQLKSFIVKVYDKIPPKEICDLNYIDLSDFGSVEWFALDETITELIPDCVYIKVSAAEYGDTKIFNTRDYEYGKKGVRRIVENIRPDAENESGKFVFSGIKKLRPRKRNDGTPENYYLDFVLFIVDRKGDSEPQGDVEEIEYKLPATKEVKKKKTKIKNIIEQRIKTLKSKRDSRKRAKQTLDKNIKQFIKTSSQVKKAKKPSGDKKIMRSKQFFHAQKLLEKYYAQGKLTQAQYEARLQKILNEYYD
jgi:hypothetical protein